MYFKNILLQLIILNIICFPGLSAEKYKLLTLEKAFTLSIANNPELALYSTELKINEARIIQSGLRKNPEASSMLENIGGSPDVTGGYQLTMQVSQELEWDNKRNARIKSISLGKEIIDSKYQVKKNEILVGVSQAFSNILNAQEQINSAKEMLKIAQKVYDTVSIMVESGKVSMLDLHRAKINLSTVKLEVDNAIKFLAIARDKLSYLTGLKSTDFEKIEGNFYTIMPLITLNKLMEKTKESPKLSLFPLQEIQLQSTVELEKLNARPNLSVNGGYRIFDITKRDNVSFVTGFSVPIPVFNQNQGTILEAEQQIERLDTERKSVEYNLKMSIFEIYTPIVTSYNEINVLKTDIIPQSEILFNKVSEGYTIGKFTLIEFLEAQKILFQTKTKYIKAITEYHKNINEIEKIIGKPI